MEKKFISLKKIFVLALCILAFFTVFKIFKGKSFFDTIVEYQNDIYSENSPIENLDSTNYFAKYEENIPIKYEQISKIRDNEYIVKNNDKIYIYDTKKEKEKLVTKIIDANKEVFEIVSNEEWLIWGESSTSEKKDKIFYQWTIWAKNIQDDQSQIIKIDTGEYERFKTEQRNFNTLIPDSFSIENDKLLYRKIIRSEYKKNNIVSDLVTSELNLYDFKENKLSTIYGLGDVSIELVSNPKISGNNIAFEKRSSPNQDGIFNRTEIYIYNLENEQLKKIIENENIISMDFKDNNIVALLGSTDPSIFICNLSNDKKTNILYKGSKVQKYISDLNDAYEIFCIEFLNNDNFMVTYHSTEDNIGSLIYNIANKKFYRLDEEFESYIKTNKYDNQNFGVTVFNDEFRINLGSYIKEKTDETNKDYEKNNNYEEIRINDDEIDSIKEDKEIYYKFLAYKLK